MSGGVDSTAAALLLKKQYQIRGFFMNLGQPDFTVQKKRVTEVAERIGIELQIIDVKEAFKKKVLDYFCASYFSGKTPNPCVICNREIKFGLFMDAIMATGVNLVATGHYARIESRGNEKQLLTGLDPKKDQSYFLSRLTQEQLQRIVFPLGSMLKDDIYNYVESHGFLDFRGCESQDVCFLKDKNIAAFLENCSTDEAEFGPIKTMAGKVIGRHQGLHRYTIGQRRGLGLPDTTPWYVCRIDVKENTLFVGKEAELSSSTITARSPHWLNEDLPQNGKSYTVRIRYSHPGVRALYHCTSNDSFALTFEQPQRAIAPGQYAVLYEADRVVGSGEIVN